MGKSLILKDERNRPGGYVMASQDGVVCRAKVKAPAQAVLFFADDTQCLLKLPDDAEQRMSGERREPTGCCVVCGQNVVFASDAAARSAWLRQKEEKQHTPAQPKPEQAQANVEAKSNEQKKKMTAEAELEKKEIRSFPERRWPPPPCWNEAHYYAGHWQERRI